MPEIPGASAVAPALLLGNGPSLAALDLASDTDGYDTFGMNAAYRHWEKIGCWPTYYACLDTVVGESHFGAILDLVLHRESVSIDRFLLRKNVWERLPSESRQMVDCYEDLVLSGCLPHLPDVTTGSHTLLWAQYLGYRTILIAGVDLDYVEQIDQSELIDGVLKITAEGRNPNYFFDDYQQPGDTYNIPNPRPNMHIRSWENAARCLRFPTVVVNLNTRSMLPTFVKNLADNPLTAGPYEAPAGANLANSNPAKSVRRLNKRTHKTENVRQFVATQIQELSTRDVWCRALMTPEEDLGALGEHKILVFKHGTQRFAFANELVIENDSAELIAATVDTRLMLQIIHELEAIAPPTTLQGLAINAKNVFAHVTKRFVPRRLRQIKISGNLHDISQYYRSVRGVVVLMLQGILSGIIAPPLADLVLFLATWTTMVLLVPLSTRRG